MQKNKNKIIIKLNTIMNKQDKQIDMVFTLGTERNTIKTGKKKEIIIIYLIVCFTFRFQDIKIL